jgi:3-methyladenine DNA glycosylase AlkD
MSDPADFIDAALQREGSWRRAEEASARWGGAMQFYGSSVGAVRGTVRDALRRYRDLQHDDVTALSSELWAAPVFERRLAAVVLLQSKVRLLKNSDLTRIEGFIRSARLPALVDPLAVDVVGPLLGNLAAGEQARGQAVVDRWGHDASAWLRRAALLVPLQALRSGGGDWDAFARLAERMLEEGTGRAEGEAIREAISFVVSEMAKRRPDLRLHSPPGGHHG